VTGPRLLRRIGVRPGHVVADLGCRAGRYALPAAKVVGERGKVHAVDRDAEALATARREAASEGLRQVEVHAVDLLTEALPMAGHSVDVVLLFDVMHGAFFPHHDHRASLLRRVRRVLRLDGLLAVYPTHARRHGPSLRTLDEDIREQGFEEISRSRRRLLHDDELVRGWVILYRPTQRQTGRKGTSR
jgi:ubiquinone/menaquinone biosynthesis C-methylase UbiE